MKKIFKIFAASMAATMTMGFAVVGSGCTFSEKIKESMEQVLCNHEWDEGEVTKEATCGEKGVFTKTCQKCGKEKDSDIKKIPHAAIVQVSAVEPTCTEFGFMTGTKCNDCGDWIVEPEKIPALGHVLSVEEGYDATCTLDGLTDESTCTVCGEIVVEHEVIRANGHSMVIDKGIAATCGTEGLTEGNHCERCGEVGIAQRVIEKKSHDYGQDGLCKMCGAPSAAAFTEVDVSTEIMTTGHWYRIYIEDFVGEQTVYFAAMNVKLSGATLATTMIEIYGVGSQSKFHDSLGVPYFFSTGTEFESLDWENNFKMFVSEDGKYVDIYVIDEVFVCKYGTFNLGGISSGMAGCARIKELVPATVSTTYALRSPNVTDEPVSDYGDDIY